jgi:hypothetical protein
MQLGFIESVKTTEATERKEFWNEQLRLLDMENKYHAVAHKVPGVTGTTYLGIFIEEIPASNGATENH